MKLGSVRRQDGFSAGVIGPIAISIWEKTPTVTNAQAAVAVLADAGRSQDEVFVLAIIGPGCPAPDGTVRDMISRELQRLGKQIRGAANVVEGEGFAAAALRGVLTGIGLLVRAAYATKTFSTVEQAAEFLAADSGVRASVIRDAVSQLRAGASSAVA